MEVQAKPKSVRTIAAFYFMLLSIFATSLIQLVLHSIGFGNLIPLLMSYLLALPIAYVCGILFANKIIFSKKNLICFLYGMLLILVALIVYDLGLLILFSINHIHPSLYNLGSGLEGILLLLLMIVIFSFVLIGSWLVFFGGLAALFLRNSFAPNVLKYAQQLENAYKERSENKK